jgi:hypothetical protein
MLWPKWVVLITGSTSSALHAVCPFQPFLYAISDAIPSAVAAVTQEGILAKNAG